MYQHQPAQANSPLTNYYSCTTKRMNFFSTAAVLSLLTEVTHADLFRNEFLPVGHVRTDAVINPDCLSDHVHTFYGPPLLYPKVTFDDLRNSDPKRSSGNIEENLSLYWHPAVYQVAADGTKTLQESGTLLLLLFFSCMIIRIRLFHATNHLY